MTPKALPYALVALVAVVGTTAARAEKPKYNIDDVTACSPDAMRLCKDKLPDLDAIQNCMKENYDRLRPACRARFDRMH